MMIKWRLKLTSGEGKIKVLGSQGKVGKCELQITKFFVLKPNLLGILVK